MNSDLTVNLALAGIDDATRQVLRDTWPVVSTRVPMVLDALYGQGSFRPDLNAEPQSLTKVAEARAAQEKHWEALFAANFDENYAASIARMARTHVRVGLRPAWFVSGYLVALTELHSLLLNSHADGIMSWRLRSRMEQAIRAIDKAVLFDLQLGVTAYFAEVSASSRRRIEDLASRCLAMTTTSEGDMSALADEADATLEDLHRAAAQTQADALAARDEAERLQSGMAAATEALEQGTSTIRAITRQVLAASGMTDRAALALDSAALTGEEIGGAAARVGAMTGRIEQLGERASTLLAEAVTQMAASGSAAPELVALAEQIKALSAQTATATLLLKVETATMAAASETLSGRVGDAQFAMSETRAVGSALADALGKQSDALRAVSLATVGATRAAAGFAHGIGAAADGVRRVAASPLVFANLAGRLRQKGAAQCDMVRGFIEDIRIADRRSEPREPCSAGVVVATSDSEVHGVLRDVSAGGASLLLRGTLPDDSGPMTISVPNTPSTTDIRIVGRKLDAVHVAFVDRARAQRFMSAALERTAALESIMVRPREPADATN